jgi:hypothetical protein
MCIVLACFGVVTDTLTRCAYCWEPLLDSLPNGSANKVRTLRPHLTSEHRAHHGATIVHLASQGATPGPRHPKTLDFTPTNSPEEPIRRAIAGARPVRMRRRRCSIGAVPQSSGCAEPLRGSRHEVTGGYALVDPLRQRFGSLRRRGRCVCSALA